MPLINRKNPDTLFSFIKKITTEPAIWGLGVMSIGCIGLWGWITNSRTLVTIFPQSPTMAPISAFLFMIFGVSLILTSRVMKDGRHKEIRDMLLIPLFLAGLWVIFDLLSGTPTHIDWALHSSTQISWMAPESSISPVSALLFLGLAIGLFGDSRYPRISYGISLVLMILGIVLILLYVSGSSFRYGEEIKPVSFLSACGFFLGGTGILMSARTHKTSDN